MPNTFCRYLSNGYSFQRFDDNRVHVSPCCWYPATALDTQLMSNRQQLNSIKQWTDDCLNCKNLEEIGQLSLRQTGPDWIADDVETLDPVCIDIRLDNNCNAACVTCTENDSSLWQKENLKLNNKKIKIINQADDTQQLVDQIVNSVSLDKVTYIKFFGGEPLFTDTHLKFLKHIPHAENVTLHYTTNGSIYPNKETIEIWKKFKVIIFAASLDGIEQQFDYLRWPLSWSKVSNNLIKIKNNPDIHNLMFRVEFTANLLNTYYFDRLENWIKLNLNSNLGGDKTEINIHLCRGGVWNPELMPTSTRHRILTKYPEESIIHKLVKDLSAPMALTPWKNFIDIWDPIRKNSWKLAFPELIQDLC